MNYEEKLQALNALGECRLLMRNPGDWYVSQSTKIKNKTVLEERYGNGSTPELAILDHWLQLTELASHEYIVISPYTDRYKAVKWNGFMWADIKEDG